MPKDDGRRPKITKDCERPQKRTNNLKERQDCKKRPKTAKDHKRLQKTIKECERQQNKKDVLDYPMPANRSAKVEMVKRILICMVNELIISERNDQTYDCKFWCGGLKMIH